MSAHISGARIPARQATGGDSAQRERSIETMSVILESLYDRMVAWEAELKQRQLDLAILEEAVKSCRKRYKEAKRAYYMEKHVQKCIEKANRRK